jgi:hypothetical protein
MKLASRTGFRLICCQGVTVGLSGLRSSCDAVEQSIETDISYM